MALTRLIGGGRNKNNLNIKSNNKQQYVNLYILRHIRLYFGTHEWCRQ